MLIRVQKFERRWQRIGPIVLDRAVGVAIVICVICVVQDYQVVL